MTLRRNFKVPTMGASVRAGAGWHGAFHSVNYGSRRLGFTYNNLVADRCLTALEGAGLWDRVRGCPTFAGAEATEPLAFVRVPESVSCGRRLDAELVVFGHLPGVLSTARPARRRELEQRLAEHGVQSGLSLHRQRRRIARVWMDAAGTPVQLAFAS